MREEEAKALVEKSVKKRFFMLVTSFTGIMAILAGTLAAYSYAYLAATTLFRALS